MSRCFPFPPPGYERRHRPEDLDLLKEAKRKEKKHKKEKKDKERKKDKEKEKDGSDEKHKEKKDRKGKTKDKKEKHRDKEDKEDCSKDKDKSSISEESIVAGKLEEKSGAKLQQRVHSKGRGSSLNEGKSSALFQGQNGGKPSQSILSSQAKEESKFVQELSRRIRDEKGTRNQLPEKVAVLTRKDQEIVAKAVVRKSSGQLVEEKGDNKNKRIERKLDPRGLRNEFSGNMFVQDLVPMTKSKVEGIPKPVDEQDGRMLEEKEKYKEIDSVEWGNKQKDNVKEIQAKEKDDEKVEKKDEKVKIKTENKKSSQNQLKDDGRNDLGGFTGTRSTGLLKYTNSDPTNEGSIKKRKEMCTNGFLRESEIRPNKLQRPDPHQPTENGRKPGPFQTLTKSPHDKHAVPNNDRVDSKDMMNGIIEAHKPSPLKPKPSAAIVVCNQTEASKIPHHNSNCMNKVLKVPKMENLIAEASRRPPHPDSMYLAKVLEVPKMDNWSESVDQEWLFSKKGPSYKPTMESIGVNDDLRVWSEAVHIESADIDALPYVIPY